MKIANSNGELVWAKTVGLDEGEIFPNQPYGMEIDSSGNLVIVGVQYTPGLLYLCCQVQWYKWHRDMDQNTGIR
jgi:hypothetical protein